MAPKTDHRVSLRAVRQLRRTRAFYAAGVVLWTAAAAWTGWTHPASRQMWVAVLLLAVFAGLLVTASLWLQRLQQAVAKRQAHRGARRHAVAPRHAGA
ncbi:MULTISPECIES: hypothetical protein [Streptomyces]|uniref:hypothetical protein n=1 Tax=Streptomyces TaxID=1883 RepID=UPI00211A12EA|nr:hypothetical protein [Streptomyces hilarionis]MCQ9132314.1 hypothetical protein [Streptomyces hilarionis]